MTDQDTVFTQVVSTLGNGTSVSSIRGSRSPYVTKLDETCIFMSDGRSQTVGSFDRHEEIVDLLCFILGNERVERVKTESFDDNSDDWSQYYEKSV
jgi:hypothetical protein